MFPFFIYNFEDSILYLLFGDFGDLNSLNFQTSSIIHSSFALESHLLSSLCYGVGGRYHFPANRQNHHINKNIRAWWKSSTKRLRQRMLGVSSRSCGATPNCLFCAQALKTWASGQAWLCSSSNLYLQPFHSYHDLLCSSWYDPLVWTNPSQCHNSAGESSYSQTISSQNVQEKVEGGDTETELQMLLGLEATIFSSLQPAKLGED